MSVRCHAERTSAGPRHLSGCGQPCREDLCRAQAQRLREQAEELFQKHRERGGHAAQHDQRLPREERSALFELKKEGGRLWEAANDLVQLASEQVLLRSQAGLQRSVASLYACVVSIISCMSVHSLRIHVTQGSAPRSSSMQNPRRRWGVCRARFEQVLSHARCAAADMVLTC